MTDIKIDIEKERAEFEAWFIKERWDGLHPTDPQLMFRKDDKGDYDTYWVHEFWQGYQQRATLAAEREKVIVDFCNKGMADHNTSDKSDSGFFEACYLMLMELEGLKQ